MTKFMTQTEYADHRGISQPRISTMIKTGKIPPGAMKRISGKKLIDMDKADTALAENLDKIHNPNPDPRKRKSKKKKPSKPEMEQTVKEAGLDEDMTLTEAQRLQANYKAALLKLDLDQKSGDLVNKAEYEADHFAAVRQARDALLNIPDRISAEVASCPDVHKVNQIIMGAMIEVLDELSKPEKT
jgi:hypothetical protein